MRSILEGRMGVYLFQVRYLSEIDAGGQRVRPLRYLVFRLPRGLTPRDVFVTKWEDSISECGGRLVGGILRARTSY